MSLQSATLVRLEKSAVDNGFDLVLQRQGDWLQFASSHAPSHIWLTALDDKLFLTLSMSRVAKALAWRTVAVGIVLPAGASPALEVDTFPELHHLIRRAFQLSRTLPDELLRVFEKETTSLPRKTEAERWVVQRVGQEVFRRGLLEFWNGRCPLTGLALTQLLRASHIKPWADCASDVERLDVFNGLLLAPSLDAAFDQGFITFADDGKLLPSPQLDEASKGILGLNTLAKSVALAEEHRTYLRWHREKVFRRELLTGPVANH